MCVIFRRITRRGRVGTLASIYGGLGGPPRQAIYAPIGLNISRFCAPSTSPRFRPSVFSILPLASLACRATPSHPRYRRPFALLLSIAIVLHVVFLSRREVAPRAIGIYVRHAAPSCARYYYFPRPTNNHRSGR